MDANYRVKKEDYNPIVRPTSVIVKSDYHNSLSIYHYDNKILLEFIKDILFMLKNEP